MWDRLTLERELGELRVREFDYMMRTIAQLRRKVHTDRRDI